MVNIFFILLGVGFFLFGSAAAYKIKRDFIYLWLGEYLCQRFQKRFNFLSKKSNAKKNIFLCITDHFEPQLGKVDAAKEKERVDIWAEKYRKFAAQFKDSFGRAPQHSWFYPFDEKNDYCLGEVNRMVKEGLGEIEFHLHHFKDSEAQFQQKMLAGLEWFQQYGAMISKTGKTQFGFIHGNFALANSIPDYCGVKNEIAVLESLGCYADFTFPAFGSLCQPKIVNRHYYPEKSHTISKSYDRGVFMKAGQPRVGLLMFSGPMSFDSKSLRVDDGRVESNFPLTYRRFENWLNANVHVQEKEDWIFMKLYTHSARERTREELFSSKTENFYREITDRAKRGDFNLYFVTAREIYNLAKAAEAGVTGSPQEYFDFEITPPRNRAE